MFGRSENENNPESIEYVGYVGYVGSVHQALNDLRHWYTRFVCTTDELDQYVIAIWTAHTHQVMASGTTPRLLIDSPTKGSGKTTLIDHLKKLCFSAIQMSAVSSPAMLSRITSNGIRTLLIDEADRSLDPRDPKTKDLIAILNSGYKKGGSRPVLVPAKGDWEVKEMPTYSPVAISGNNPLLPEDTRSRCITVRLLPDIDQQIEPSDWEYIDLEIDALALRISETMDKYSDEIKLVDPDLPDGCINRLRERWRPLKRLAIVGGKYWAQKIDELIIRDIENERELADNTDAYVPVHIQLLKDLYQIFESDNRFIPTSHLVRTLVKDYPEHWSITSQYGKDLTAQKLGRELTKGFGIYSKRIGDSPRGYNPGQFETVWRRLGISPRQPTEPTEPTDKPEIDDSDLF